MSKKDSLAVVSGMGVEMSIIQTLVAKVKKAGGTDEDVHHLATSEGEAFLEEFAERWMARGVVKNIFRLVVGGKHRTTEEMIEAGKYNYVNSAINSQRFPMRPQSEGERKIEFIGADEFEHEPTSEEVLAEAKRRGLEEPDSDDALYFGEQFPEEQRKRPIVFLHKSVLVRRRRPVVVLSGTVSRRNLYLSSFAFGWYRYYVFAFVRK